jgi:hypothetical protein
MKDKHVPYIKLDTDEVMTPLQFSWAMATAHTRPLDEESAFAWRMLFAHDTNLRRLLARMSCFVMLFILSACSHSQPVPPPVPVPSPVSTLTWTRNPEPDVRDYLVYFCWTVDCAPHESPRGPVMQTAVGVNPRFVIELTGSVGAVAVTARNKAMQESPLSNVVRFDRRN